MNCKDLGYKTLFVSYGVIAYIAIAGDLVGDVKTKLSTAGCYLAISLVYVMCPALELDIIDTPS